MLVAPEADALAAKLSRIIDKGQTRVVPAFNNEDNIQVWYQFHRYLTSQENKHDLLSQLGIAKFNGRCPINIVRNQPSQHATSGAEALRSMHCIDEIVLLLMEILMKTPEKSF